MRPPGVPQDRRLRCAACGNLTRFDIESSERVRRYWHADLSGSGNVEDEVHEDITVEAITCRWCGSREAIEYVDTPAAGSAKAADSPVSPG